MPPIKKEDIIMDKIRRYEIEGLTIDIPIYEDEKTGKIIEVYPDFLENPLWTSEGHRVLFAGTDACPIAEEDSPGGCPDCGSCKHFMRAGEQTWFGICKNRQSPMNIERK